MHGYVSSNTPIVDTHIHIPSCIESLSSSCEQLRQLATKIGDTHIKTLLTYGYFYEPPSASASDGTPRFNLDTSPRPAQSYNEQANRLAYNNNRHSTRLIAPSLDKLVGDQVLLESMSAISDLLPYLNQLSSLADNCCATIKAAFKRLIYHLNKIPDKRLSSDTLDAEFYLTSEAKFQPLYVAIMDLNFAMLSLDSAIASHTNIARDLGAFREACELVTNAQLNDIESSLAQDAGIGSLPRQKLLELIEMVRIIEITLCKTDKGIFKQCIDQIHDINPSMGFGSLNAGFQALKLSLEEFIIFYCENLIRTKFYSCEFDLNTTTSKLSHNSCTQMLSCLFDSNIVPTVYMNTAPTRLAGVLTMFIFYCWIFRSNDRRRIERCVARTLQSFKSLSQIKLAGSNSYLRLDELLYQNLPAGTLDKRTICVLECPLETCEKANPLEDLDRFTMLTMNWMVGFKSECAEVINTSKAEGYADVGFEALMQTCPISANGQPATEHRQWLWRRQMKLVETGLALMDEINTSVWWLLESYKQRSKPIDKSIAIGLIRSVALVKSIEDTMQSCSIQLRLACARLMQLVRFNWSRLMLDARNRLMSLKYSDGRLSSNAIIKLTGICSQVHLFDTSSGRASLCLALSMLVSSFETSELQRLMGIVAAMPQRLCDIFDGRPPPTTHTSPPTGSSATASASHCGYLYWSLSTLASYYNYAFEEQPCAIGELPYVHMALNDIETLFVPCHTDSSASFSNDTPVSDGISRQRDNNNNIVDLSWLHKRRSLCLSRLGSELAEEFRSEFVDKVCQELEIELRLQTHRDLQMDYDNPFKRRLYNFKQILLEPNRDVVFSILGEQIVLRHYVSQYLNRTCYNLTTLVPNDWLTYDRMLNLARIRYDLRPLDTQLPSQTLDQGLDLLEIMRNLPAFVTRYTYDSANRLFVEKLGLGPNRHMAGLNAWLGGGQSGSGGSSLASGAGGGLTTGQLGPGQPANVVHVKHVARSIQTHGYGVLSSAVNCAYKLMKKLLGVVSGQLSDERFRAVLAKQHKHLLDVTQQGSGSLMSFERANRLAQRLSKLECSSTTSAELGSVRQSVTQLGNLMAFVRMLKGGALECASRAADHLPSLGELRSLRLGPVLAGEQLWSGELSASVHNLDECLAALADNFEPTSDYLATIVSLFAASLSPSGAPSGVSAVGQQLEHFYLLVPALTIDYIEHATSTDERSRGPGGSVLGFGGSTLGPARGQAHAGPATLTCDDGFALGVAFLLTVLRQTERFGRLQWFGEARAKLAADRQQVESRLAASGGRGEAQALGQTASLTLRRVARLGAEFGALEHALGCALVLARLQAAPGRVNIK